jgi:four helix bundle protein
VPFKFETLEVWQQSLDYIDLIYGIAGQLPKSEEFNLKSQMMRAATSVALNIAEGSTGQTGAEQARFVGLAIRSLVETVACQHIISRRKYLQDLDLLRRAYRDADALAARLQKLRTTIAPNQPWLREPGSPYELDAEPITIDTIVADHSDHLRSSVVGRRSSESYQ